MAVWLFAPATYNERPELVELVIQNALANPIHSRSPASCASPTRCAGTTRSSA